MRIVGLRRICRALSVMVVAGLATVVVASPASAAAAPPGQPASGPGGQGYQWSGVTTTKFEIASNRDYDYWTLVPTGWTGGGAAPTKAPVVVFEHGWMATAPSFYKRWVEHLARKGNVVIFPKYQDESGLTPGWYFSSNAIWSVKDALSRAFATTAVKPDTAKGLTLIGHSAGGRVALDTADQAAVSGLPTPKAVFAVEPADTSAWMPLATTYGRIPTTTKVVCLVGDTDANVGREGCDLTFDRITHIPATNKNYVWMFGDAHGSPALVADHGAPTETDPKVNLVDALDWYGTWKIGDGLRDCGANGTNCAYAIGNTTQQRNMGTWNDGVAVRPLQVWTAKPAACPTGSTAKHC